MAEDIIVAFCLMHEEIRKLLVVYFVVRFTIYASSWALISISVVQNKSPSADDRGVLEPKCHAIHVFVEILNLST